DHVVLPDTKVPGYPYSESGQFYEEAPIERHEQLIGMAYIAAKTSRIRLVAAVLVVPHRPAVLAAKMLATLDVLSGGRLVVGIGRGWLKTEFDAVVTTPFPERGAVTDEYIDAFRVLWTEHAPRFAGRYTKFDGIVLEPKPVQQPHPPIWVGGHSGPAVRRAARIGNLWYPIGSNNQHLLDTLPRLSAGIARPGQAAAAPGRGPPPPPQGRRRRRPRSCVRRRRLSREALWGGRAACRHGWRATAILRQRGRHRGRPARPPRAWRHRARYRFRPAGRCCGDRGNAPLQGRGDREDVSRERR